MAEQSMMSEKNMMATNKLEHQKEVEDVQKPPPEKIQKISKKEKSEKVDRKSPVNVVEQGPVPKADPYGSWQTIAPR